ncbi:BREX system P-loop protein BrxC [Deinococcus cellulosilyticus]|uniref:Uncharacterized protein n=1 Tax=Deinococcus cellulosilyticus (strain DSM 18568 / NBRC 106333 / KACC 11606 / 5516J-15) TaxID=1223518 RepID=A0A511N9J9_DEIC1|nr:BREX system P-loop protein BrxC [Deinococcus cellulosilyticus]GEM49168.1 hypothetical protein DC3_48030 [Deinococcus cellulosilyticus NBRC 106333 = KACC 11606]
MTLLIEELFTRNINRNINGVIKVGQKDQENVHQELDEYVITSELSGYFHKFFDFYAGSFSQPTDKIGIWISGFFGSGKSHFLKILSYLLENKEVDGKKAADFFDLDKVKDPILKANIDKVAGASGHTDVLLFNIDSKSSASSKTDKEAIVKVLQKVLDDHLGYFGANPGLAQFERQLDLDGKYGAFKAHYQQVASKSWEDDRHAFKLRPAQFRKALSLTLQISEEEARQAIDSISPTYFISIDTFARELKAYLDRKGKNSRIIFMIDEVGQYIGDNTDLMLNLQTVAEDLGIHCPGRAWVMVTSQEAIDSITKQSAMAGRDFSKIQGRFRHRVNLSSSNSDEVIKLRLLGKTPEAEAALKALYADKSAILKNQIWFSEGTADMPTYTGETAFVSAYPFVPYQFKLLQHSFTQIRTMGSSGKHLASGERSMLDAFQAAAQQVGNQPLGVLAPFHTFYAAVEGFLDHNIKQVIEGAKQNSKLKSLDVDLLKTLFLIKYVKEIKGTVENLTTLSLSHIDQVRLDLKKQVEAALLRLEKETLISRNGEEYSFLTNEEQDVGREIKQVDVTSGEITQELQSILWDSIFTQKQIKVDNRPGYPFTRKVDGLNHGQVAGDFSLHVITPEYLQTHLQTDAAAMLHTGNGSEVLVRLPEQAEYIEEIREWLKTNKYIKQKNTSALSPSMQTIINQRAEANNRRKARIETQFKNALQEAAVFASGNKVAVGSSDPREILMAGLRSLIENTYTKYGYVQSHYQNDSQLQGALNPQTQQDLQGEVANEQARKDLLNFLNQEHNKGVKTTVKTVLERFKVRPYGWSELDVLGVMLELWCDNKIEMLHQMQPMQMLPAQNKQLITNLQLSKKQDEYVVRPSEVTNPSHIKVARELAKEISDFPNPSIDASILRTQFLTVLGNLQKSLETFKTTATAGNYPFQEDIVRLLERVHELLSTPNQAQFYATIAGMEEALLDDLDVLHKIQTFFKPAQQGLFDATRKHLSEIGTDEQYIQDEALKNRVQTAKKVLSLKDPTGEIPKLSGLLSPVLSHLKEVLEEERKAALTACDNESRGAINLMDELASHRVDPSPYTRPMLDLRDRIEKAQSITALRAQLSEIKPISYKVTDALTEQINLAMSKGPDGGGDTVVVAAKPIKTLKANTYIKKAIIETPEDVEDYLEGLRKAMLKELAALNRVRIE